MVFNQGWSSLDDKEYFDFCYTPKRNSKPTYPIFTGQNIKPSSKLTILEFPILIGYPLIEIHIQHIARPRGRRKGAFYHIGLCYSWPLLWLVLYYGIQGPRQMHCNIDTLLWLSLRCIDSNGNQTHSDNRLGEWLTNPIWSGEIISAIKLIRKCFVMRRALFLRL